MCILCETMEDVKRYGHFRRKFDVQIGFEQNTTGAKETHIETGLDLLSTWWRHQMEIFSVLLAFCVGNSPVTGGGGLEIWDAIAPIMMSL